MFELSSAGTHLLLYSYYLLEVIIHLQYERKVLAHKYQNIYVWQDKSKSLALNLSLT